MGPGYTTRDLFTYGGFIAGIAVFMVGTNGVWDVHHFVRLIVGVIVGLAGAWVGDRIYTNFYAARKDDEWDRDDRDDDRFDR